VASSPADAATYLAEHFELRRSTLADFQ
jgi:hypothetical protein